MFSQQLDYYTPHPDHVYSQQVDAYAHIDRRLLDRYDEERLSFRNLRSMRSQDKYAVTKIDIGIIDGHNEQSQKAKNEMLLNKLARLTKGIGKEQRKQLVTASQIDEQEQLIETDCRSIERQHTAID